MQENWILRLTLSHSHGLKEYRRDMATPVEIEIESPRSVERLKTPAPFNDMRLEDAVFIMKRRQIRREIIDQVARRLAGQIADTIEDAAGWHGEDRAKGVREAGLVRD